MWDPSFATSHDGWSLETCSVWNKNWWVIFVSWNIAKYIFLGAWHKHPRPTWHSYPEEAKRDYTPYLGDSDVICLKGWCQVWYTIDLRSMPFADWPWIQCHVECPYGSAWWPMHQWFNALKMKLRWDWDSNVYRCSFQPMILARTGDHRLTWPTWGANGESWNMLKLCALDTVHISIGFCNDALPQCTCKELHHMKCRVISNGRQALDRVF